MDKEQKSFRPDGTVEQEPTTPASGEKPASPQTEGGSKDEKQAFTDYNGNSEENAPARAREE